MTDQVELFEAVKDAVRELDRRRKVELLTWLEAELIIGQPNFMDQIDGIIQNYGWPSLMDGVDLHELAEQSRMGGSPSKPLPKEGKSRVGKLEV